MGLLILGAAAGLLTLAGWYWWSANAAYATSKPAFDAWLSADQQRAKQFERFSDQMRAAGVAEVVPLWQLWRVDADYTQRCNTEMFVVPPEDKWSAIVPTLRIVGDSVVPAIGPIEVVSAYRSPQVNECIGGATRSQHLNYRALDMIPIEMDDNTQVMTELCEIHQKLDTKRRAGLGAYYDLANPLRNRRARFHMDNAGHRRWGYDYTRKSDPCPNLLS